MVESIKELRLICEKDTRADRPVSEVIPRFFAIYITWILLHTRITANQVTLMGFLLGFAGGILFISGNPLYILIGSLLLLMNFQLDYVDGEIARYRKSASLTGRYISTLFGHHLLESWVFVSLAFGVYNALNDVRYFAFGFAASLSVLLIRLAVFNTYSGVVEAGLRVTAQAGITGQISAERPEGELLSPDSYVMSYVASFGSIIYKVFENLLSPGRELMLLTAAILDIFIDPFNFLVPFNFIGLFLIFWGVVAMLAWMTLATIAIRKKTSEVLFRRLFQR